MKVICAFERSIRESNVPELDRINVCAAILPVFDDGLMVPSGTPRAIAVPMIIRAIMTNVMVSPRTLHNGSGRAAVDLDHVPQMNRSMHYVFAYVFVDESDR
jgi:hypothetical protein